MRRRAGNGPARAQPSRRWWRPRRCCRCCRRSAAPSHQTRRHRAVPQRAAAADHEPYSPERLAQLRAQGKPVFVNLTASWCITCLVNERVALSTDEVRDAFEKQGVTYLKGDWTRQDPRITELLKQHDRSGVPLYLFYPAGTGSGAQVLPQLLTPGIVTTALRAGTS
ncbi:thioredoxin family protein [Roseateles sp. UC29_93]|uniref:thioredoxin family protein n=1 Tax=Roseateles sp. UC29_93 TaxID=3350177 RepID=UPI00366CCD82